MEPTPEQLELRAALDADRSCVNFPRARTLRTILLHGDHWRWLAGLTDGRLDAEWWGRWTSNELDANAAAGWEQRRRRLGVSLATVAEWLGVAS